VGTDPAIQKTVVIIRQKKFIVVVVVVVVVVAVAVAVVALDVIVRYAINGTTNYITIVIWEYILFLRTHSKI